MTRYQKVMTFLAYLFGLVALLAILVDDKKDKFYSFHIWQALFLNVLLSLVAIVIYSFWLPSYILTFDTYQRTNVFLLITLIPLVLVNIGLITLGILATKGINFRIPLIGFLVNKFLTKSGG